MPYSVRYIPSATRPGEPWAKILLRTGKIVSRHRSKAKALAAIAAYYATRNEYPYSLSRHSDLVAYRPTSREIQPRLTLNATNPLRFDPTRTTMIRKRFLADIAARFRRLKAKVNQFMVEQDALGLGERKSIIQMAQLREFQFRTDPGKLTAFNEWFQQQVKAEILSSPPGSASWEGPWTVKYVESAYKRGQINAYLASRSALSPDEPGYIDLSQAEFLRQSFNSPETLSKILLLATRSFEDLKGVSAQMGMNLNRILAQGIADGSGPRAIAKEMTDNIDNLTNTRALLIARTESIYSHAEGQLDAFTRLGVEELGLKAEWSTAGDDRVCDECAANEGQVFSIDEARGMIPLHPACRCSWTPFQEPK